MNPKKRSQQLKPKIIRDNKRPTSESARRNVLGYTAPRSSEKKAATGTTHVKIENPNAAIQELKSQKLGEVLGSHSHTSAAISYGKGKTRSPATTLHAPKAKRLFRSNTPPITKDAIAMKTNAATNPKKSVIFLTSSLEYGFVPGKRHIHRNKK